MPGVAAYASGTVECIRPTIARLYLRGWFTVDLIAAIPFAFLASIAFGAEPAAGTGEEK